MSADNYDLISQSYTEGTQSAFLVGILAVFGVLLGCALLVVLNLSAYEVQQQRLSLLLTLGVSPKNWCYPMQSCCSRSLLGQHCL